MSTGASDQVRVYRRHWLWIALGRPHRVIVFTVCIVGLAVWKWDRLAGPLVERAESLSASMAAGIVAFFAGLGLPFLLTRWREARRAIIIDHTARQITFRCFLRWAPPWRPNLGDVSIPFSSVRLAARVRWPIGLQYPRLISERPIRVITRAGVVQIPPGMARMPRLHDELWSIAVAAGGSRSRFTRPGYETVASDLLGICWIAIFLALLLVLFPLFIGAAN